MRSSVIRGIFEGAWRTPARKAARVLLVPAVAMLAMALPPSGPATASGVSEQQVKAAFLVNFARYITWPATAFKSETDPIVIGIYGDEDLSKVLKETAAGRQVGGRPLEVVEHSGLGSAVESHILFIGSSRAANRPEIIRATGRAGVFAVSDFPGFAKAGGVANFTQVENKIRFEINEEAAKRAGLTLSSKLLRLAILVN